MAKFLRRVNYNGTNYEIADLAYAVCSTPSATLNKVVDSGNNLDFELLDGIKIVVKFENAVTMQNSTLKVGNTAAKLMKYNGAVLGSNIIKANQVCQFVYSSSEDAWIMIGGTGSGDVNLTDILIFKGVVTPSSGLPAIYEVGATYRVGTAGNIPIGTGGLTIGPCEAGDMIICVSENSTAANASTNDWAIIQTNLDGAVIGPANSLSGDLAMFDGITGKLITDSGYSIGDLATAGHVHGNLTNDGKIGSDANKAIYTGTGGLLQAGVLPVAAGGTGVSTLSDLRDEMTAKLYALSSTNTGGGLMEFTVFSLNDFSDAEAGSPLKQDELITFIENALAAKKTITLYHKFIRYSQYVAQEPIIEIGYLVRRDAYVYDSQTDAEVAIDLGTINNDGEYSYYFLFISNPIGEILCIRNIEVVNDSLSWSSCAWGSLNYTAAQLTGSTYITEVQNIRNQGVGLAVKNRNDTYISGVDVSSEGVTLATTGSGGILLNSKTSIGGNLTPSNDNTYDLGSSTKRWANIYGNATSATAANLASTQYGVAYYNDTTGTFAGTAAGNGDQVLVSEGGAAPPSWKTLGTTTINSTDVSYSNGILTLSRTMVQVMNSLIDGTVS